MLRTQRLPFSAESTFKANRPFVLNGIQLGYDDIVDTSGIEERRLLQMYQARLIDVAETNAAPQAKATKPKATKAPKAAPAAPEPVVEAAPEAPAQEPADAPSDAPKAVALHKGFGKWNIETPTGDVLVAGLTKEEAARQLPNYL